MLWGALLVATSLLNTYKFCNLPGIFQNLATKFFKGLTQNSTLKLKVEIQFDVDSENSWKILEPYWVLLF